MTNALSRLNTPLVTRGGSPNVIASLLARRDVSTPRLVSLSRALTAALERRLRRESLRGTTFNGAEGLLEWSRTFLPGHFTAGPSPMHRWLAGQLATLHESRGWKINLVGPRGAAKSTLGTLAYVLRAAVEGWEPYIWIVCDTAEQAATHLDNLKAELLDDGLLADAYPQSTGRGPVWRREAIVLGNGVKIEAFGTGQHLRGRRHGASRPSLLVCDDLQNDAHIASAVQREAARSWFHGALLKAGTKHTNVLHLATALHREALALELDRTPGWTSAIFPAIARWPAREELWQQWEDLYTDFDDPQRAATAARFYREHQQAMHAGAEVLWPEVEDLYTLMRMRVESGKTTFEREMQGRPLNPQTCEWPEEYFDGDIWFDTWPRDVRLRVMALDPSKGRDATRGDYSALVMMAVDQVGRIYVEADMARRPTPQIVADGVDWYGRFAPDVFAIESNQFQELLGAEFTTELKRCGHADVRPWLVDNRVNKLVRIRRLGPYLSQRRLRFKSGSISTRLLVDQMRDFPQGDYDDGPDALEMALRMAAEVLDEPQQSDGLGSQLIAAG